MKQQIKWYTITEYIDETTGEILPKYLIERGEYLVHKTEKKTKINEKIAERIYTKLCIRNPQQKLL